MLTSKSVASFDVSDGTLLKKQAKDPSSAKGLCADPVGNPEVLGPQHENSSSPAAEAHPVRGHGRFVTAGAAVLRIAGVTRRLVHRITLWRPSRKCQEMDGCAGRFVGVLRDTCFF